MADSATANKRLRKQSLGSNTNTWGDTKLNEVLDVIDQCMDGYESIALTGNLTLATTNYSITDQAKYRVINFTGTAGAVSVTFPSVQGWYLILNNTNGAVTVLCSGGTGVAIPAGYIALVYGDGTDLHNGAPNLVNGSLTITGALTMSGQIHGVAAGTAGTDAVNVAQMGTAIATAGLPATAGALLNSVTDTTAGYLSLKVQPTVSGGIAASTNNPGANESLNLVLNVNGMGTATDVDPTSDFVPIYDVSAGAMKKALTSATVDAGQTALYNSIFAL
ncbi:MAG: hypothetical protein EPO08_17725 [Rhodospirillaceae bacterium]|nr:MAG: hypothetical protein EPO08_17725 [Rhodospirillaceae bacterium]